MRRAFETARGAGPLASVTLSRAALFAHDEAFVCAVPSADPVAVGHDCGECRVLGRHPCVTTTALLADSPLRGVDDVMFAWHNSNSSIEQGDRQERSSDVQA